MDLVTGVGAEESVMMVEREQFRYLDEDNEEDQGRRGPTPTLRPLPR